MGVIVEGMEKDFFIFYIVFCFGFFRVMSRMEIGLVIVVFILKFFRAVD